MASSSSSAPSSQSSQPPKNNDVFISFRGEDVRRTFASHLDAYLCKKGIKTYIDYKVKEGDEIWLSLENAIKDSKLFLVIFSKDYASSTWCLNELTEILECCKYPGILVIPVFYNIEPTHIRKQTGSYGEAFTKHEQNHDSQQVLKWKEALTRAANLKGCDSSHYRDDAQFIEDIVRCVCKKLEPMYESVSLYGHGLFGIQPQIEKLESLLCIGSGDTKFIGIWGMGGIGKTTIAKALFEKWHLKFESFCFLSNVREEAEKNNGIENLKKKMFSILSGEKPHLGMPDGGFTYAWQEVSWKKVFIVLDDVNDASQLKKLADRSWFGEGSRVIITTRDQQLLSNRNIDNKYQVTALEHDDACKLFKLKALENDCPKEEFDHLWWEVVDYAKGIPLVLEELGFILRGQDNEKWKSQLKNLRKGPIKKVQQILQVSYDGLDKKEKTIFLDVACFFIGQPVEKIKYLLDACGYETINDHLRSLRDKTLLIISDDYVSMNKLIQQMGWEIVREECFENPGNRSRLWDSNDICQVLKYNKGSKVIRGISQDVSEKSETKELDLSPQVFAKMGNLKFIQIYSSNSKEMCRVNVPQGTLEYLSRELRYLRWVTCPLKFLPSTFFAENLVELDMQRSKMEKLWDGVQILEKLKIINLSDSIFLTKLPDFSKASNLKMVILSRCSSLREVHPSISSIDKLEVLNFNGCTSLRCLTELPPSLGLLDATNWSLLKKIIVTSIAAKPMKANMKEANFQNCLELDDHSVKAILANVMVHINKSVSKFQNSSHKTEVIYPGSIVPQWFQYKTTDATSVTIDLSSAPRSKDWGLLFCVIVPQSISNDEGICIEYEGYMRIISDKRVYRGDLNPAALTTDYWSNPGRDLKNLISDHVFLWYDEGFCSKIHKRLEESRATSIPKISLELNFRCDFLERQQWHRKEIKMCGVCPTYDPVYQNFIRQMELKSQTRASGMGNPSIFPTPPIATWKNRTRGLKDSFNP